MRSIDEKIKTLSKGEVAVLGAPLDENSSFLRGAAQAPKHIREALHEGSSNMSTEPGIDLASAKGWQDIGDLRLSTGVEAISQIERAVSMILDRGAKPLVLGGDHSITYPSAKACASHFRRLSVVDLDAHPDLYEEYDGSRLSHACPFARLMEEGSGVRLIQIGIRASNPQQRARAKRYGAHMMEMTAWPPKKIPHLAGKVYLSLDLDALDPAFAPGVSHHEPGGLTTRDALDIIHNIDGEIIGADIVELNPRRDLNGVTARVASKFYKEIVGLMLEQSRRSHPRKR